MQQQVSYRNRQRRQRAQCDAGDPRGAFGVAERDGERAIIRDGPRRLALAVQVHPRHELRINRQPIRHGAQRGGVGVVARRGRILHDIRDVLRRQCDLPLSEDRLRRRGNCGQAVQKCVQRAIGRFSASRGPGHRTPRRAPRWFPGIGPLASRLLPR